MRIFISILSCFLGSTLLAQFPAQSPSGEPLPHAFYYTDSVVYAINAQAEMHQKEKVHILAPNYLIINGVLTEISEFERQTDADSKADEKWCKDAWKMVFEYINVVKFWQLSAESGSDQLAALLLNSSKQHTDASWVLGAFANLELSEDKSIAQAHTYNDLLFKTLADIENNLNLSAGEIIHYANGILEHRMELGSGSELSLYFEEKNAEPVLQQLVLRQSNVAVPKALSGVSNLVNESHLFFYKFGLAAIKSTFAGQSDQGIERMTLQILPHLAYSNLRFLPEEIKSAPLWQQQVLSSDDTASLRFWKQKFNQKAFDAYVPAVNDALAEKLKLGSAQPWVKLAELLKLATLGKSEEEDFDEDWLEAKERMLLNIAVVSFDYEWAPNKFIDRCFWIFDFEKSYTPYSLVIDNYTEKDIKDILTRYHNDICGKESYQILGNTFSQLNSAINQALQEYFYD